MCAVLSLLLHMWGKNTTFSFQKRKVFGLGIRQFPELQIEAANWLWYNRGGINQGVPDGERGMGKVPCNTGKSAAFAGLTDKIN